MAKTIEKKQDKMLHASPVFWNRLVIGTIVFTLGMIIVVAVPSWFLHPSICAGGSSENSTWTFEWVFWGIGALASGLGCFILLRAKKEMVPPPELEPERSRTLYSRYLVGVGYALVLDGLLTLVALSGLACSGCLQHLFPPEDSMSISNTHEVLCVQLMVATAMALEGALFFFANAMWKKMKDGMREPFSASIFWAGLWFRIGEAFIFTLVLFLIIHHYGDEKSRFLLPVLALLVGMFLKSGEVLIAGMAERVFAAISNLVPRATVSTATEFVTFTLKKGIDLSKVGGVLRKVSGVKRVAEIPDKNEIRIVYDPTVKSVSDLKSEILLQGAEITE